MDSNSNKKYEIIYPENSSDIITKLMKKHGLEETTEDFFEKIKREETTIGEIIARAVAEATESKISFEDFVSKLQQDLDISEKTAEKLAEDLEQKILVKTEKVKVEEEKPIPSEKTEEVVLPKKTKVRPEVPVEKQSEETTKKPQKRDLYREPIE